MRDDEQIAPETTQIESQEYKFCEQFEKNLQSNLNRDNNDSSRKVRSSERKQTLIKKNKISDV